MSVGVLNQQQMRELTTADRSQIKCLDEIDVSDVDPSAIDIPLGKTIYEMDASCRTNRDLHITDLIQRYKRSERPLEAATTLKCGRTYLIELPWSLALHEKICARATAKSSIGRLDTLVRLVADREAEFETVSPGQECSIYVEVRSNTFDLQVSPGDSLSQIRFLRGEEDHCSVPREQLRFEDVPPLVNKDGSPAGTEAGVGDPNSILLRLDLDNDPHLGFVGFVAKRDASQPINPALREEYDPKEFWETVVTEDARKSVRIKSDHFYIFRSKQRFRIPPHLAVDCRALSESLGDIRIHYAGFAHPFFGYDRTDGAPLIFEVRGYQFDTIIHDGTALAKVFFRRMSQPAAEPEAPSYSDQELTLSKCFKAWS